MDRGNKATGKDIAWKERSVSSLRPEPARSSTPVDLPERAGCWRVLAMILMQACASMHIMLVAQMVLIDAPTLTHGDIPVVDGKAFAIYMRPSGHHLGIIRECCAVSQTSLRGKHVQRTSSLFSPGILAISRRLGRPLSATITITPLPDDPSAPVPPASTASH